MKPSDKKRLLADITDAQDIFSLTVTSVRATQFTISTEVTPLIRESVLASKIIQRKKDQLDEASIYLRRKGWKVMDISLPGAEFKTYMVEG